MEVLSDTYGITAAPFTPQIFGGAGKEHMEKYGMLLSIRFTLIFRTQNNKVFQLLSVL